jgi:nanoRNase/pAp phosphatase (c-di-AMP/oligoRNAs hydrolase)
MFAYLGSVANPDICVIIADFFMKISSVNWSIVSGLYSKKLIIVFRNDGLRKDAGKVARQSFGQIGSAGGHKSMARAEIPFEALKEVVDYRHDKKLLRWIINKIEKKAGKK